MVLVTLAAFGPPARDLGEAVRRPGDLGSAEHAAAVALGAGMARAAFGAEGAAASSIVRVRLPDDVVFDAVVLAEESAAAGGAAAPRGEAPVTEMMAAVRAYDQ